MKSGAKETHQLNYDRPDLRQPGMGDSHQPAMLLLFFLQTQLLTYDIFQNKHIPITFSKVLMVYDWISVIWHI